MDVQELCRNLKPIIGERAEHYWTAYLAEDSKGKQDIETALQLLAVKTLGHSLEQRRVHLSVPTKEQASGQYELGEVMYNNRPVHPFGLREDELIQHCAVFGRSGAGKTNTLFKILDQFLRHKKPFLIFDWKRNYRDLIAVTDEPIHVYTVGRSTVPLVFNPLIPPQGTEAAVWLKKLIEIVATSYYLGEGVMFLLQEAIHDVYTKFGVYRGKVKRYPTFEDVHSWLQENPAKGRKALWMDSAMRGIKSICFGHMGQVVNTPRQSDLGKLLEQNVILELDGLSNADKSLITQSMLLWIHHYRMQQPERETFKHAILIEEAHHILRKQAGGGSESVTETILREIRELGESILLADQHPSMISIPALGNTYTTITMNLKHRSDVSAIAAAMLMDNDEQEILGQLAIGEAVVKLQGRWTQPFQVRIPYIDIPKGSVDEATLIQHMTTLTGIVPNSEEYLPTPMPGITEGEERFLKDIAEHPLSGVVERYKRLGTNRRKGNDWKEQCFLKELITPIDIPTRSGKVVLLKLTKFGEATLRQRHIDVPAPSRWGGLEHEYWKGKIGKHLLGLGFDVTIEEGNENFENAYTDIVARKNGKAIAIEVETGKSDWRANVTKNLKKRVDRIILAVTNEEAEKKIREQSQTDFGVVTVMAAWKLLEFSYGE